jgi:hypothetical protein
LDLVPEHVREDLIDDASSDAFSYWIRRCRRAARRLRSSVREFFVNDRNGTPESTDMLFQSAPSVVGAFVHENAN